jgi:hypothetical protein
MVSLANTGTRCARLAGRVAPGRTTQAARRVAVAQRIVAEQKALIDRLKAARRDTAGAERLLRSFEDHERLLRGFEELCRLTVGQHVS